MKILKDIAKLTETKYNMYTYCSTTDDLNAYKSQYDVSNNTLEINCHNIELNKRCLEKQLESKICETILNELLQISFIEDNITIKKDQLLNALNKQHLFNTGVLTFDKDLITFIQDFFYTIKKMENEICYKNNYFMLSKSKIIVHFKWKCIIELILNYANCTNIEIISANVSEDEIYLYCPKNEFSNTDGINFIINYNIDRYDTVKHDNIVAWNYFVIDFQKFAIKIKIE